MSKYAKKDHNNMIIGNKVYHRALCQQSSMDWVKEEFEKAPHGALFVADYYTTLRGRQGRVWHFFPGQLIMTFVLKPHLLMQEDIPSLLYYLAMAFTVAVAEALHSYGVGIKWPNDFVILQKKLGGILIESLWQDNKVKGVVIGVALNINNLFDKFDSLYPIAISLRSITKQEINMQKLQDHLLLEFNWWYSIWKRGKFDTIYNRWRQFQICLNKKIQVHTKNGSIMSGCVADFCANGNLILVDSMQKRQEISFCVVESIHF